MSLNGRSESILKEGMAHTRRHLKKWMRPRRRHTSLLFAGARNRVIPQPKGVVGIISPWNYPLQLAFSPVTLELGGKSPTIVAKDFDIATAADRILYVKLINAGQTCVAPDYLFLPEGRIDAFVDAARRLVAVRYPHIESEDYTAITDERAYQRLLATLADAETKGALIVQPGPQHDPVQALRKIPPTIVLNVSENMRIMQEEIFGPLLPIKTYRDLDEVIAYVNARPRPLALYLFTNDKAVQQWMIYNTLSGGVGINDCAVHVAQQDLPFGGIGNSGMGQYHAYEGFLELSKLRPIFTQAPRTAVAFMYPPYGRTFERVCAWMMRLRYL